MYSIKAIDFFFFACMETGPANLGIASTVPYLSPVCAFEIQIPLHQHYANEKAFFFKSEQSYKYC